MALKPICRLGDTASGNCSSHSSTVFWTGTVTTVSAGFSVDGLPVAAVGDRGLASCGHLFEITTGSSICTGVGGKIVARQDSSVVMVAPGNGIGHITGGSLNVSSE